MIIMYIAFCSIMLIYNYILVRKDSVKWLYYMGITDIILGIIVGLIIPNYLNVHFSFEVEILNSGVIVGVFTILQGLIITIYRKIKVKNQKG